MSARCRSVRVVARPIPQPVHDSIKNDPSAELGDVRGKSVLLLQDPGLPAAPLSRVPLPAPEVPAPEVPQVLLPATEKKESGERGEASKDNKEADEAAKQRRSGQKKRQDHDCSCSRKVARARMRGPVMCVCAVPFSESCCPPNPTASP